jgi:hypothetical protein
MKHSIFQGVVKYSGGTMVLTSGQRIDPNHPLVTERPDLFAEGDSHADVIGSSEPPPVIETTAQTGPGGNRVRRTAQ